MYEAGESIAIEELAALVAAALRTSDTLRLWDVSIGLDRARLAIEKLRSDELPQLAPVGPVPAISASASYPG